MTEPERPGRRDEGAVDEIRDADVIHIVRTPGPAAGWHILELSKLVKAARDERDHYRNACVLQAHDIEQTLGKALGYPPLPADWDTDVAVGDHTAESLADEAAGRIHSIEAEVAEWRRKASEERHEPVGDTEALNPVVSDAEPAECAVERDGATMLTAAALTAAHRAVDELRDAIKRADGAERERDEERAFRRELIGQHTQEIADLEAKRVAGYKRLAEQITDLAQHDIARERERGDALARELGELRGALRDMGAIADQMHWFWMDREYTGDVSPGYGQQRMDELLTKARAALEALAQREEEP